MRAFIRRLMAATVVAIIAGAMSPAQASIVTSPTYDIGTSRIFTSWVGTGNFSDTYNFSVAHTSAIDGTVGNLPLSVSFLGYAVNYLNINNLKLELKDSHGNQLGNTATAGSTLHYAHLATNTLYSLIVSGNGVGIGGGTYGIAYSISAVPVPGALLLFGSSLIGLAAYGRRANARRKDAPAHA